MRQIAANKTISASLLAKVAEGMTLKEAFSTLFSGVMTWDEFAGQLYDDLNKK